MIKSRIIDSDMGHVAKVPLTGRGTIHGLTVSIDDHSLPEFDVGLLEVVSGDGGLERFRQHASEHFTDADLIQKFTESYQSWSAPILKSGKIRY